MVNARKTLLNSYPIALILSAASVYFFTQPIKYPSIHLGPIIAYVIALTIQLLWLTSMFVVRIWETGVGKAFVVVNVVGVVCAGIGVISYSIYGEVYSINIDLDLGPLIAVLVAAVLLLLLVLNPAQRSESV